MIPLSFVDLIASSSEIERVGEFVSGAAGERSLYEIIVRSRPLVLETEP
jgi:hypothetical protein